MQTSSYLALIIAALIFCSGLVFADTTHEMLSACRSISSAKVLEGQQVSIPSGFESGKCWGAFLVIQKLARKGDISLNRRFNICAPANSGLVQLTAVFVSYAEQNPQRWHEDFFDVALDSLQASFPCSRSG